MAHLKIRSRAKDGRVQVLDEAGNPIDGVISVEFHAAPGSAPLVRVVAVADVVIDADDAELIRRQRPGQAPAPSVGARAEPSGSGQGGDVGGDPRP